MVEPIQPATRKETKLNDFMVALAQSQFFIGRELKRWMKVMLVGAGGAILINELVHQKNSRGQIRDKLSGVVRAKCHDCDVHPNYIDGLFKA